MKYYLGSILVKEKKLTLNLIKLLDLTSSLQNILERGEQIKHHHKEKIGQIHSLGQMIWFLQQDNSMTTKGGAGSKYSCLTKI